MKYWMIVACACLTTACTSVSEETTETDSPKKQEVSESDLDSKVSAHIKSELNLTAIDKFDSTWYSHDITGDNVKDYIITVNLLDRAINEAIEQDKVEKMKAFGYMGYFNVFFFVNGATENISNGVVVPSSPMRELDVTFAPILGIGQTDFYVDYRVRNMKRRKFFTIDQGKTEEVCQAVIFDGLGTSKTEAYAVRIEDGTLNDFNDIVEYEAKLQDTIIPNFDSTYHFEPTITPTDNEVRRWHYSPTRKKYFMIQKK